MIPNNLFRAKVPPVTSSEGDKVMAIFLILLDTVAANVETSNGILGNSKGINITEGGNFLTKVVIKIPVKVYVNH